MGSTTETGPDLFEIADGWVRMAARIEGKWKVSQNRSQDDREGVAKGLGTDDPMAALVLDRGAQV
jgi:predicted FMN-binding regulatory protein PaiB